MEDLIEEKLGTVDYQKLARRNVVSQKALGGRSPHEPRNVFRTSVGIEDQRISPYSSWREVQEAARKIDPEILNKHVEGLIEAYRWLGENVDESEVKKVQQEFMEAFGKDYS